VKRAVGGAVPRVAKALTRRSVGNAVGCQPTPRQPLESSRSSIMSALSGSRTPMNKFNTWRMTAAFGTPACEVVHTYASVGTYRRYVLEDEVRMMPEPKLKNLLDGKRLWFVDCMTHHSSGKCEEHAKIPDDIRAPPFALAATGGRWRWGAYDLRGGVAKRSARVST